MTSMSPSGQANKRKAPEEVAEDAGDIVYVSFSIRGQDGRQLFFKVNQHLALITIFRNYCDRLKLEYETMQFLYEGVYVKGERQTPKMLNMENGAEILAARYQTGGGVAALAF